jgi:methionyl-tRNA formyltransferase
MKNNGVENRVKIFNGQELKENHSLPIGQIQVRNSEMIVATSDGFLKCLEIQLPNKKRMSVSALLNGYSLDPEAKMV